MGDFGLVCRHCEYPLGGVTRLMCPECGEAIELDDYIPGGAMPPLYAEGKQVRLTDEIAAVFERYAIPYVEESSSWGLLPGMTIGRLRERGQLTVARTHYFEAIDLLRRMKLGEAMPPEPPSQESKEIDWTCPACTEDNPGNFEVCWSCGAEKAQSS